MVKVRRCFWVDDNLFLMISSKGIDPSSLINRFFAGFLDLPEDPRDLLIKQKTEEIVIRLRISYEQELKEAMRQEALKDSIKNQEKAVKEAKDIRLMDLGDLLQELNIYPQLERDLMQKDMESDLWDTALALVNSKSGTQYDLGTLWNTSLEWFKVYGMKKKA